MCLCIGIIHTNAVLTNIVAFKLFAENPDMVRHQKGVLVHDGETHRRKHASATSDIPDGFCSAYAGNVCSKVSSLPSISK